MNSESIRKLIIATVEESNGIKATELATKVASQIYESGSALKDFELPDFLEELVKSGDIAEVEAELPNDFRIRSFYFPKGTKITLISNEKQYY